MTKDMGLGLIALAFSVFYTVEAARIPASALGDAVGAGGIPSILGWVMGGTSLLLILHQLWAVRTGRHVPDAVSEAFETPGRTALLAAGVLAIGAAYIALIRWLGYIPATALFIAAMLLCQRVPASFRLVLVPVSGALVLWLLFDVFLGIALPDGLLAGIL